MEFTPKQKLSILLIVKRKTIIILLSGGNKSIPQVTQSSVAQPVHSSSPPKVTSEVASWTKEQVKEWLVKKELRDIMKR